MAAQQTVMLQASANCHAYAGQRQQTELISPIEPGERLAHGGQPGCRFDAGIQNRALSILTDNWLPKPSAVAPGAVAQRLGPVGLKVIHMFLVLQVDLCQLVGNGCTGLTQPCINSRCCGSAFELSLLQAAEEITTKALITVLI